MLDLLRPLVLFAAALVSPSLALAAEDAPPADAAPPADDTPPTDSAEEPEPDPISENDDMNDAWRDMATLRLSNDLRWAEDTVMDDGVCRATLTKGVIVPVTSGRKVVDERAVGAVFFGEGTLEVRFPAQEDAIAFANHMFEAGEMTREELAPIVAGTEPFRTTIDRAAIFTADRQLGKLMRSLDPVGGGMKDDTALLKDADEHGVDAEYVVTSSKGEFQAKLYSKNLLPDRRRALLRSGMDPAEILRFDRMVHDWWNVPWKQLRMIMEFRSTDHHFHPGQGARANPHLGRTADQWLSCFRDGSDHGDLGLRSMAFSHAVDNEGVRYLSKFSGERFFPNEDGEPLPPTRFKPVDAQVEVETKLIRRVEIEGQVKSLVTFRAREDGVQHLFIKTPRHESIDGSWAIERLDLITKEDKDKNPIGPPLAFMGLDTARARGFSKANMNVSLDGGDTSGTAASSASGSTASTSLGGGGSGAPAEGSSFDEGGDSIFNLGSESLDRQSSYELAIPMSAPQELIIALPKPLARGEEITIAFDWRARWPFANIAVVQGAAANQYRSLGSTTGPRSFLPDLIPTAGGNIWDFSLDVSVPPRRLDVVLSGDTTDVAVDEGGWVKTSSSGRNARQPALAVGRWATFEDPPAAGMPGVNVHLFKSEAWALEMFPPEVRRVLSFLRRYMPLPEGLEVDVYQGKSHLPRGFLTQPRGLAPAGMVGIKRIKIGDRVGEAGTVDDFKYIAQQMLAQQVVSQVWGQVVIPASGRDAWVAEALTESFGYFYVRAALKEDGFEAFEDKLELVRENLETGHENFNSGGVGKSKAGGTSNKRRRFMSLTDGGSFALTSPATFRDYSFYVLGRMLRERVGDYNFFKAIDLLTRRRVGHRITTEQLREAFEQASGQDLEEFFAYWVRGGYVPNVIAEYRHEAQPDGKVTVHACIITDIPFGSFDLPIAVGPGVGTKREKKQEEALAEGSVGGMVNVVDGRASFEVPDMDPTAEVAADPFGLILAYSRVSKKVDQTTCEAEGLGADVYSSSGLDDDTEGAATPAPAAPAE
jgi:hypothetical protein